MRAIKPGGNTGPGAKTIIASRGTRDPYTLRSSNSMLYLRHLALHLRPSTHFLIRRYSREMERVTIPGKMEIRLTEAESELCTLLDGCTNWMRERHEINTSCRIAGGWVRDKVRVIPLSGLRTHEYLSERLTRAILFPSFLACRAMTSTLPSRE